MRLEYLNKDEKEIWLPRLFHLFYENMHPIVADPAPYEQQIQQWLCAISPALEKAPRQVILCLDGDRLAGFCMYYTRQDLLMVEELQIQKEYQSTSVFFSLCRFLGKNLPAGVRFLEAFAHRQNLTSQRLMGRLGMQIVDGEQIPGLVHLRGELRNTIFKGD